MLSAGGAEAVMPSVSVGAGLLGSDVSRDGSGVGLLESAGAEVDEEVFVVVGVGDVAFVDVGGVLVESVEEGTVEDGMVALGSVVGDDPVEHAGALATPTQQATLAPYRTTRETIMRCCIGGGAESQARRRLPSREKNSIPR